MGLAAHDGAHARADVALGPMRLSCLEASSRELVVVAAAVHLALEEVGVVGAELGLALGAAEASVVENVALDDELLLQGHG